MANTGPIEGSATSAPHWLDEERVRVYSWMIVAIFALVFVVWFAMSVPDLVDPRGKPIGYDFMAFWSAARLALGGRPEAAFDGPTIAAVQHAVVPFLPNIWFPWHYPPIFLLVVTPFGLLPYPGALVLFVLGSAALWALLVREVLPDPRAWIVAAATPAGLITLVDGQNAFLTAALAGFALLWLERRPVAAGVLVGLLAIKPHLALLFPLALLAEVRWRSIAAAAATLVALTAASLVAFGWISWAAFLHHLSITQAMADQGAVPWGTMPSPFVFARSLGASVTVAGVLQGVVALFSAGCVWRAWRRSDAAFEAKAATLVAGSLLVSPYLFYYDLTWAALATAWLAQLGLRDGFHRGEREILLFAWLAPAMMQPVHVLTSVQLGFPALLMLLLVALRRAAPFTLREREALQSALDAVRTAGWVTRERLVRWGIAFTAMSVVLLIVNVILHTTHGLTNAAGDQLAADFINYWSGAQLAASGQAGSAYDHATLHAFERAVTGPLSRDRDFVYPPVAMLLSLPLALFAFIPALVLWSLLGVGLCIALLRRLAGWRVAALAVIGAPAAYLDLDGGQNGHFTAALFAGGMMLLDRRPGLAGLCLGCLAYKPQMALLVPVALAAGGRWVAFVGAGLTLAVLCLASLWLFGSQTWILFFDQMAWYRQFFAVAYSFWHRMPTVFAAARELGAGIPVAYAAQIISAALAIAVVTIVWRSTAPTGIKAATLAVATFLAVPYAEDYDGVMLVFAAAWLGREGVRTGFLPWERIAIVTLLAMPFGEMIAAKLAHVQPGPVVLWAVLVVLARRAIDDRLPGGAPARPANTFP